jgi:hypothetical protein
MYFLQMLLSVALVRDELKQPLYFHLSLLDVPS